jgi:Mce-associated membrane protein
VSTDSTEADLNRDGDPETASTSEDLAESVGSPGGRNRILAAVAVVLIIALSVAAGALSWKHHQDEQVDHRASEAKTFAEKAVVRLLAYTPENISSDLDAESGLLTGSFRKDYRDLVTETIAPAAEKSKVTTSADVVSAGVINSTANRVDLLLFLNVSSTTAADRTPQVNGSRIEVRVERVRGSWRISKMDPV